MRLKRWAGAQSYRLLCCSEVGIGKPQEGLSREGTRPSVWGMDFRGADHVL